MTAKRMASFLLTIALALFGFDLFHFGYHLGHDPTLLELPGVWPKLAWKGGVFILTLGLLIGSGRAGLLLFLVGFLLSPGEAKAGGTCERTREFMKESGIARDAKEDFFGRVKIKSPQASFPPEMDQVTWWGTFKPFEFWESPQFEAVWINPGGETVDRQSFRGGRCQLAKTTLPVEKLPRGKLEPGMWRVIVTCQDVVIDNHPFAVVGSPEGFQDAGTGEDSGVMIWADDVSR